MESMFRLLAVVVVIGFAVVVWHCSRARNILKQWADGNGYEILSSEQRWLRRGPFWLSSAGQEIFYVTIRTSDGGLKSGWVRCGSSFLGILVKQADVQWDE
jgi:hypothetical protein